MSCGQSIKRKQRVAAFRPEAELRTVTVTEWQISGLSSFSVRSLNPTCPLMCQETVQKVGGQFALWGRTGHVTGNGRGQVQWRVMVEVSGAVGAKQVHEVDAGGSATPGCSAATVGLSLAETKAVLADLQRHLVQAQAEEHCQIRRRCPRCGKQRPLRIGGLGSCGRCSVRWRSTPHGLSPANAA